MSTNRSAVNPSECENVEFFMYIRLCIVTNFSIINQLDATILQIYFGMKLYMFRTDELSEM